MLTVKWGNQTVAYGVRETTRWLRTLAASLEQEIANDPIPQDDVIHYSELIRLCTIAKSGKDIGLAVNKIRKYINIPVYVDRG